MKFNTLITIVSILFTLMLLIDNDFYIKFSQDDEYNSICTNIHKTVRINNYKDLTLTPGLSEPILFKIKNTISKERFTKALSKYTLNWSKDGNSNTSLGKIRYSDFITEIENGYTDKYIFDINREFTPQVREIQKLIQFPRLFFINDVPKVVIYSGCKNTGTSLHTHDDSLNYLIHGKKLWIVFPETPENTAYISKDNYYEYCKSLKPIDWFYNEQSNLKNCIKNLSIFIQNSGETVYIPFGQQHAVINLENSFGFTYNGDYI